METIKYTWKSDNPMPNIGGKIYSSKSGKWYEVIDLQGKELTLLELRTYTSWAGNNRGVPEDRTRCIAKVSYSGRSVLLRQCSRKRGYGKDGLYCKTHAKIYRRE